jgi:hypothetical protein
VATDNFSSFGGDRQYSNSLYSIPKAALTAAAGPSLGQMTRFDGAGNNQEDRGFILQPVVDWSPSKANAQTLAISLIEFGQVMRTPISGSAGTGATMLSTEAIATQSTAIPIPVRQPDGTGAAFGNGLDTSDDRFASTAYQVNDLIYVTRQIGLPVAAEAPFPDRTGVRWTVLRVMDGSATHVVAEGTIGSPDYDFFQPAIAANADGDVVLVYNRSGSGTDGAINAFYSTGTTAPDGSITFGLSKQITTSTVTDYHNENEVWGLYSSVSPDPSSAETFWAVQQVPAGSSTWGTQITRIVVPEPSCVFVCAAAGCLLLSTRSRKGESEAAL